MEPLRAQRWSLVLIIVVTLVLFAVCSPPDSLPADHEHHYDHNTSTTDDPFGKYISVGNIDSLTKYYETEAGGLCIKPTDSPAENQCQLTQCTSNSNCTDPRENCCFNGCIYTCQTWLSPPLALDWIEEPIVYNTLGSEQSSEETGGFLSCSTTIRSIPSKIEGCPDGYKCQIYETGDPITRTPNKGICITDEQTETTSSQEDETLQSSSKKELVILPGGCLLTTNQYNDLENFLKGGHYVSCKCDEGSVACKVGYNGTLLTEP